MKFKDIKCIICGNKQKNDKNPLIRMRGAGMAHMKCISKTFFKK